MTNPRTRDILRSLCDFSFTAHEKYNLSEKRLTFLETLVRQQASYIIE